MYSVVGWGDLVGWANVVGWDGVRWVLLCSGVVGSDA